jgi:hypothetical protein
MMIYDRCSSKPEGFGEQPLLNLRLKLNLIHDKKRTARSIFVA